MVGVYDNIQSFYASDDPFRYTYKGFTDNTSMGSGYQDLGFVSEPPSFMNLGDPALGYDPYRAEQQGVLGNISVYDREYIQPSEGMINAAAYDRSDPFSAGGDYYGQGEVEFEDDRSYLKMLKDFLGIEELIGEENVEMVTAFARAAGLLDKKDVGLSRTEYKAKSKTPSMKQGAKMAASRKSVNKMAAKSRMAPSGDEYFRRQNISEMGNRVADLADSGTGTGPRGKNIRDPSLSDIRTRKYVMATA